MQVQDLTDFQKQCLTIMAEELMTMGVMWALDAGNRDKLFELSTRPDAATRSALDLVVEAMDGFPASVVETKPSTFDDFLVHLS